MRNTVYNVYNAQTNRSNNYNQNTLNHMSMNDPRRWTLTTQQDIDGNFEQKATSRYYYDQNTYDPFGAGIPQRIKRGNEYSGVDPRGMRLDVVPNAYVTMPPGYYKSHDVQESYGLYNPIDYTDFMHINRTNMYNNVVPSQATYMLSNEFNVNNPPKRFSKWLNYNSFGHNANKFDSAGTIGNKLEPTNISYNVISVNDDYMKRVNHTKRVNELMLETNNYMNTGLTLGAYDVI